MELLRGIELILICGLVGCVTSDQCLNGQIASPLDYVYGYHQPQCSCRSQSTCSTFRALPALMSSGKLCSKRDVGDKNRVAVTIRIVSCCGTDASNAVENVTIDVWQPDRDGTYTQRSECYSRLQTNSKGEITFHSPVPGPLSLGADGRESAPQYKYGPISVVAHNFSSDSKTKAVRLFYQAIREGPTDAKSYRLNCSGPERTPFNISNVANGSKCTFTIKMGCQGAADTVNVPQQFINWREKQLAHGFRHGNKPHNQPRVSGCPKISDLKYAYSAATLVMLVEICDPSRTYNNNSACNAADLRKYAALRQSLYLAKPLRVFKGTSRGTVSDSRIRTLANLKLEDMSKWAILVDHHMEIDCCSELELGQQYMVMGVPLPTVPAKNPELKVARVWAERVNTVHGALYHLLED